MDTGSRKMEKENDKFNTSTRVEILEKNIQDPIHGSSNQCVSDSVLVEVKDAVEPQGHLLSTIKIRKL